MRVLTERLGHESISVRRMTIASGKCGHNFYYNLYYIRPAGKTDPKGIQAKNWRSNSGRMSKCMTGQRVDDYLKRGGGVEKRGEGGGGGGGVDCNFSRGVFWEQTGPGNYS